MKLQIIGLYIKMLRKKIKIILIVVGIINTIVLGISWAQNSARNNDILSILNQKKEALKMQELEVERRKKELIILQKRISEEIKRINQLKDIIKEKLEEIKKMETERYMELANLYASIPPKNAGKIMEKLNPKLAARIMLYMDKKKAGIIWGFIDPKKACEITKEMVRLK